MISITIPTNDNAINFSQKESQRALLKKISAAYDYKNECHEWKSEWFLQQLKIKMPLKEDMDYSDDVWWNRKYERDELIDSEDLSHIPDSEWAETFYEFYEEESEDEYDLFILYF